MGNPQFRQKSAGKLREMGQTAVEVDLTAQIAGKKALQKAAAAIAERLLSRLVKK